MRCCLNSYSLKSAKEKVLLEKIFSSACFSCPFLLLSVPVLFHPRTPSPSLPIDHIAAGFRRRTELGGEGRIESLLLLPFESMEPFIQLLFSFLFRSFLSLSLVYATAMGPQLSASVAAQVQLAVAGGNSPTTPPVVSPMATLMSITDTLPPGSPRNGPSPPQQVPQRSASRGSQHSTHSSGTITCHAPT